MKGISMKLITAIIKPFKLDDVRELLGKQNINGITVSEVKGYGRQLGRTEMYRGAEYTVEFLPKVKLEIAVNDDVVDRLIQDLSEELNTNKIGDGKIWVTSIETIVRVRTGETGKDAV
jgi:nitrogen regulatory protein P-II 2|tara:strand:- start:464 stop:817 length:354 start_codon:yes stop_codon:yes gene_type:complete